MKSVAKLVERTAVLYTTVSGVAGHISWRRHSMQLPLWVLFDRNRSRFTHTSVSRYPLYNLKLLLSVYFSCNCEAVNTGG